MNENELKEKFKEFVKNQGFKVVKELNNNPPDLIIEKSGKKIAVEIKGSGHMSWFSSALGQLLFAKMVHNVTDLWLIIPKIPSVLSIDWVKLLWSCNIVILFPSKNEFSILKEELLKPVSRIDLQEPLDIQIDQDKLNTIPKAKRHILLRSLKTEHRIFNLLKEHSEGLTMGQIAKKLGMRWETVKSHIIGPAGIVSEFSLLKDKTIISDGKICLY